MDIVAPTETTTTEPRGGSGEMTPIAAENPWKDKKSVDNLLEFINSLNGFNGKVVARDGSTDFEIYVKDGEIVGALVKDGSS